MQFIYFKGNTKFWKSHLANNYNLKKNSFLFEKLESTIYNFGNCFLQKDRYYLQRALLKTLLYPTES